MSEQDNGATLVGQALAASPSSPVPGLARPGFDPSRGSDAVISDCGRYRYVLTRRWDSAAYALPIIMLNPSTADASIDDPTIRRCIGFAKREGFGGITVTNLFAFRATSPADMKAAADPYGPDGSKWLERALAFASEERLPVLAAWGTHGGFRERDQSLIISARGWDARLVCLGTTKGGYPKHPLYVAADQPFVPFAAQGTPTRSAETTGSVGKADGGPVRQDAPTPSPETPHDHR
jgi:hypothetical protein